MDKLDGLLFSLLNVSCDMPGDSKRSAYQSVESKLCQNGYNRPWSSSVRERLFAISWITIVNFSWRSRNCECLFNEAKSYPNIASIYPELFFVPRIHSVVCPFALSERHSTNVIVVSKATALAKRKCRIYKMLRLFRQLDMTRGHLLHKITERIETLGAPNQKQPQSQAAKNKIKRRLAMIPLALAIQPRDFSSSEKLCTSKGRPNSKLNRFSKSDINSLSKESLNYMESKNVFMKNADHESTFYRWIEKAIRDTAVTKVDCDKLVPSQHALLNAVQQCGGMLAKLEETTGLLYIKEKCFSFRSGHATRMEESSRADSLPSKALFERANVDMDIAPLCLPDHDNTGADCATSNKEGNAKGNLSTLAAHGHRIYCENGYKCATTACKSKLHLYEEMLLSLKPLPPTIVKKESLTYLRERHSSMLNRAALACERYSPYEFSLSH